MNCLVNLPKSVTSISMDEALRIAVRAAAEELNPKMSRSCPLSDLVDGLLKLAPGAAQDQDKKSLVQRLALYSKAPPAMLHVNHLLSCSNPPSDVDDKPPSQNPDNLDLDKFIEFFTPEREAKEKRMDFSLLGTACGATKGDDENCILMIRNALLEACEHLGKQFGSRSPTPREFLMQRLAAAPMTIANNNIIGSTSNQESLLDLTFTNVIENSLLKFEQPNDASSIELVEFIVAAINEASIDFSTKLVLAERLIFCLVPHPKASAGSTVLLECFQSWLESEVKRVGDIPVIEPLVAAIGRLAAGSEVKELLKQVMWKTSTLISSGLSGWRPDTSVTKQKFKGHKRCPKRLVQHRNT